jgi:hypothetical protein
VSFAAHQPSVSILQQQQQQQQAAPRTVLTYLVVLLCAGLSETFIMLDDDFFLTAPWTLSDFIGPDGGQILTGRRTF